MDEKTSFEFKIEPPKHEHASSKIQADTLFHFMNKLDYLLVVLKNKMLSPRYCEEDISYLEIPSLEKIAFPLKCFCDINLHRLGSHVSCYGCYGLAFSKNWGMENGIQPIHYINPESNLRKDFSEAFQLALDSNPAEESQAQQSMQNYLLHELMYSKPYQGEFKNRVTEEIEERCFTDECEWRFVPDVTVDGFEQVYYNEEIIKSNGLITYSNEMSGRENISLKFTYNDLKYIIIKEESEFTTLTKLIDELDLSPDEKYSLISKIIIWEKAKGDF